MAFGSGLDNAWSCAKKIIIALTLFTSVCLTTNAEASDDKCLKVAFPEATRGTVSIDLYRNVMRSQGLCVDVLHMPNGRAVLSMKADEIDVAFAALGDFDEQVGIPLIRGGVQVGNPAGLLVVREGTISSVSGLSTESIGIWLGAVWSERMLGDHPHVVRCPGGPDMMLKMLDHGRIDGMLINSFSLGAMGGVPDGFVAIPVIKLDVFSWLQTKHADILPQFDAGTAVFRQKVLERRSQAN
jgi:hypothetical protein